LSLPKFDDIPRYLLICVGINDKVIVKFRYKEDCVKTTETQNPIMNDFPNIIVKGKISITRKYLAYSKMY